MGEKFLPKTGVRDYIQCVVLLDFLFFFSLPLSPPALSLNKISGSDFRTSDHR